MLVNIVIMLLSLAATPSATSSARSLVFVSSRLLAGACYAPSRKTPRSSSTLIKASFFDDMQKNVARTFSSNADSGTSKHFTVGVTGSSGLVGTALRDELRRKGQVMGKPVRVVKLVRGNAAESGDKLFDDDDTWTETTLTWNPSSASSGEVIDIDALGRMDAVVHLAGENVATGLGPLGFLGIRPWTKEKKGEILNSRVVPTRALASAVADSVLANKNSRLSLFLVTGGVGAYGDKFIGNGVEAVDETADIENIPGFLARVSREWEAACDPAVQAKNIRVVNMRFGVVLSTKGGALAKLYPIFFLGGSGNVGSGDQYFSFILARDHARAIVYALETPSLTGPVNFSSPQPCTNAEFTKALGKVLNRPTILPLPSFAVSLLFGEMGEEMLLGGV